MLKINIKPESATFSKESAESFSEEILTGNNEIK